MRPLTPAGDPPTRAVPAPTHTDATLRRVCTVLLATVVLAALGGLLAAEAQQAGKLPRIGFLAATTEARGTIDTGFYNAFRQGLGELGYVEGKNIAIEYRSGDIGARLAELASELVLLKVDVIVAAGPASSAAKRATAAIPIVFAFSGDPVVAGFVASLARPGGNMTGFTFLSYELTGKRLELLKEVAPTVSRVAVLADPAHPGEERELKETQGSARSLRLTLDYHPVKLSADLDRVFDAIVEANAHGLLAFPDRTTLTRRKQIAEFAARRRIPSVFGAREYVEAGGLISYGPNRAESYRRLATYVDKILKGAKPSEIPVEQPTKLELVINLKTAKALGLAIPPSILLRADHVIE